MTREIARFFLDYDIWLTPTLGEPPVPLGTFDAPPDDPMRAFERAAQADPTLPEVHLAMAGQNDVGRLEALERASQLLRKELVRWVRRGEALDMIVRHLPDEPR